MKKNQIDIITLGCSKNLVDSELLMKQFEANGYHCVHDSKRPQGEIAVINTCGFIEDAKQESIDTILEFIQAKEEGRRIIAVGTTSVRTLESAGQKGKVEAGSNWTQLYIYPGYQWHVVDAIVTNFHLPESTLIMMMASFAGREHILAAYEEAVRQKYRFFSFGDAMFLR